MTELPDNRLILFTLGQGTDHAGRFFHDILALDNFWLEHTHDYIQWLFPIPEAGRFNGFAPVLDTSTQACFGKNPKLREQQSLSLNRMLDFFGLVQNGMVIEPAPNLNSQDHLWLKTGGHNHLRITRMIRSLHYCHQPKLAEQLQTAVMTYGPTRGYVGEVSCEYWRKATE
tara:strand:- start:5767 stop:6279 length:513 start_codon:yes stop_codon:yes gene_type:complete